jgi:signal peptidase II
LSTRVKLSLIVLLVLFIDQALKIWVKTHMHLLEEFHILGLEWARIYFIENEGMAFGITFGGKFGKLALSIFRLVAIGFLIYLIDRLVRDKEPFGLLMCFALILAGATGNIIDSAFYGMIFSESYVHGGVATIFPEEGGYASFLHGRVVDMFYFPVINTTIPDWVPFWGGNRFRFFQPVFNVADTSISIGVISILLFYRSFFRKPSKSKEGNATVNGGEEKTVLGWGKDEEE